jgi:PII-like signaling protein
MSAEKGLLLRLYVGEGDKHGGMSLYDWLVKEGKKAGLGGATVTRGSEGFGSHKTVHTNKILDISTDLPVVVEFIDSADKINAFMPVLEANLNGGVAVLADVEIRRFGK